MGLDTCTNRKNGRMEARGESLCLFSMSWAGLHSPGSRSAATSGETKPVVKGLCQV